MDDLRTAWLKQRLEKWWWNIWDKLSTNSVASSPFGLPSYLSTLISSGQLRLRSQDAFAFWLTNFFVHHFREVSSKSPPKKIQTFCT